MSKSFGNYPDPKMVLEKYGGDALRVYLMGSPVMRGEDMNFYEEGVAENYRFLLIFWNTYKFFIDNASLSDWKPVSVDKTKLQILDKWILAKLAKLTLGLRQSFDKYDTTKVVALLKEFIIEDYSTWYVRRSRSRASLESDKEGREITLSVMHEILVAITKLAAPLAPFITEEMFKNLTGRESVHLEDYPEGDKSLVDEKLIRDMAELRKLVEMGHAQRKEANIKLRQPLQMFSYTAKEKLSPDLEKILADELNVKDIEYKNTTKDELSAKMDTKITPELAAEGEARDLIRQVQQLRKEAGLTLRDKVKITVSQKPQNKDLEALVLKQTNALEMVAGEKDNQVVEVLRKGYKLEEKVLRVAQVKVSKKVN